MKKAIFGMLLFSLSTINVYAKDTTSIVGAGKQSCASWSNARETPEKTTPKLLVEMMMSGWVQGFLSGANVQRSGILEDEENHEMLNLPDPDTLLNYLDNYCRENQLSTIFEATLTIFLEARDKH